MSSQNHELGVNLEQLLVMLKRKGIPLPFEIGTFVALQASEVLGEQWGVLRLCDVWLADDGEVAITPETTAGSEDEATRAMVALLADLLVAAAPGVPAMLLSLIERGPSDGLWMLSSLRDDLGASLVPLNRSATKRVLARLLREAGREGDRPSHRMTSAAPSQVQMDDELDALLGGGSVAAPTRSVPDHSPFESVRPPRLEDQTQEVFEEELSPATQPRIFRPSVSLSDELEPEESPAPIRASARAAVANQPVRTSSPIEFADVREREGRGGLWVGITLLLLAAGIGGAYVVFGKDKIRALLGAPPPASPPAAAGAPAVDTPKYGDLVITSTPDRAQVFLFAGRGPAIVDKLPVGVAHELLAIADGRTPTRAVVPADAAWEDTPEGPRYELAMQTGEAEVAPEHWDFGPTRLPSAGGTPSSERGNVRVVTSPPGARVYQLIGFTPGARIDNVLLGEPLEALVYLPGHAVERVTIAPDMFVSLGDKPIAQVDVALRPLAKRKAR